MFGSNETKGALFLLLATFATIHALPAPQESVGVAPVSNNGLHLDCRSPKSLTYACQYKVEFALPNGQKIEFAPNAVLEVNPRNLSISLTFRNGDNILYRRELSGRNPPEVCVPIDKFPIVEVCYRFHDIEINDGSIQACTDIELRTITPPLLIAKWYLGCLTGSLDGLSFHGYSNPVLVFPPEQVGKSGIPVLPLVQDASGSSQQQNPLAALTAAWPQIPNPRGARASFGFPGFGESTPQASGTAGAAAAGAGLGSSESASYLTLPSLPSFSAPSISTFSLPPLPSISMPSLQPFPPPAQPAFAGAPSVTGESSAPSLPSFPGVSVGSGGSPFSLPSFPGVSAGSAGSSFSVPSLPSFPGLPSGSLGSSAPAFPSLPSYSGFSSESGESSAQSLPSFPLPNLPPISGAISASAGSSAPSSGFSIPPASLSASFEVGNQPSGSASFKFGNQPSGFAIPAASQQTVSVNGDRPFPLPRWPTWK